MTSSNEPTKLSTIVVPMFEADDVLAVRLRNDATVAPLLGVREQDDCAAFALTGGQTLVFGSDYVRGPKFTLYERGLLSEYDIGWFLAAANLSDIAAMGAVPVGLLSVIRYPRDMEDLTFAEVLKGVRDSCRAVGAANVGGDIGTAERLILSASAFGAVEPEGLLTRAGARPGQIVVLTGETGLAGAALRYSASAAEGLTDAELDELLRQWRRVTPRVSHGRLISGLDGDRSCIDTSDGLAGALNTICAASGVRIAIDAAAVPISPVVAKAAALLGADVLELVFGDSVDFELVATVDAAAIESLRQQAALKGLSFYEIGVVTSGAGAEIVRDGVKAPLPGVPWSH